MDDNVGRSNSSDIDSDEWEYCHRKKRNKLDENKTTREFSAKTAKRELKRQRFALYKKTSVDLLLLKNFLEQTTHVF